MNKCNKSAQLYKYSNLLNLVNYQFRAEHFTMMDIEINA